MAADFARVREVFEAAVELPAAARGPFLQQRCEGDDALRREVDALLRSDASTTPFARALDGPAVAMVGGAEPLVDATIGGFRVQRVLGSGGMGTVYAAEQETPRRQVALKVLSLGLRSSAAVARFRYEAELLARLRHPGIAQVHAAGVHRQGEVELPWFALELVPDAQDLAQYAQARALSVRERIELLLQACDAVHHAHLHGVVHRDLKPANVLVGADGRIKVIDFGVARSTGGDDAPATEPGVVYGTLAYMSPEQVANGVVDLRSDVWALGVIAFELLTGRRPFAPSSAPWRAAEQIRNEPAPRASAFARGLPADLDAVLGKALRVPAAERYESAAAFAADLRAVLAERPVSARPASTWYHVHLFARRRRGVVTALAAITGVVVAAVTLLVWQNAELRREQRLSQRVAAFARDFLLQADERQDRPADYTVREALERAAAALDGEAFSDPVVEAELRLLIGDALRGLSQSTAAIAQLTRAAERFAQGLGPDAPRTLEALLSAASARCDGGDIDGADAAMTELVPRAQRLPAEEPVRWRALHERAFVSRAAGRLEEAETLYREVLAGRERVLGRTAAPTIVTLHNLGSLVLARGEAAAARELLADCLERSKAAGEARTSTWQIADSLASAMAELGEFAAAAAIHRQSRDGYAELLGPDHALTLGCAFHLLKTLHRAGDRDGMRDVAFDLLPRCERTFGAADRRTMDVLAAVALAKMQAGDRMGALADMERAHRTKVQSLGAMHPDAFVAGNNLAEAQLDAGVFDAALATTQQLVDALPDAKDVPTVRAGYTHFLHARALSGNGRAAAAGEAVARAVELLQPALPADHAVLQRVRTLADELAAARGGG